jgi:hypothetical protein
MAQYREDFTTDGTDGSRAVGISFPSVKSVKSVVQFFLLAPGRAPPLVRPLWGQHDTQVANAQALVRIRIFSHFSIDIHTYQLYNGSRMVRNGWTDTKKTKEAKAESWNPEN